jgi:hypothetical protein
VPSAAPPDVTKRAQLLAVCSLAPPAASGACGWCGTALPPRRRSWCSDRCGDAFWANHWWSVARRTAKRRDRYRCARCGVKPPARPSRAKSRTETAYRTAMRTWRRERRTLRLEVNHIEPALGRHGQLSCVHHLVNLETLCVNCHRAQTAAQVSARSARTAPHAADTPR